MLKINFQQMTKITILALAIACIGTISCGKSEQTKSEKAEVVAQETQEESTPIGKWYDQSDPATGIELCDDGTAKAIDDANGKKYVSWYANENNDSIVLVSTDSKGENIETPYKVTLNSNTLTLSDGKGNTTTYQRKK